MRMLMLAVALLTGCAASSPFEVATKAIVRQAKLKPVACPADLVTEVKNGGYSEVACALGPQPGNLRALLTSLNGKITAWKDVENDEEGDYRLAIADLPGVSLHLIYEPELRRLLMLNASM